MTKFKPFICVLIFSFTNVPCNAGLLSNINGRSTSQMTFEKTPFWWKPWKSSYRYIAAEDSGKSQVLYGDNHTSSGDSKLPVDIGARSEGGGDGSADGDIETVDVDYSVTNLTMNPITKSTTTNTVTSSTMANITVTRSTIANTVTNSTVANTVTNSTVENTVTNATMMDTVTSSTMANTDTNSTVANTVTNATMANTTVTSSTVADTVTNSTMANTTVTSSTMANTVTKLDTVTSSTTANTVTNSTVANTVTNSTVANTVTKSDTVTSSPMANTVTNSTVANTVTKSDTVTSSTMANTVTNSTVANTVINSTVANTVTNATMTDTVTNPTNTNSRKIKFQKAPIQQQSNEKGIDEIGVKIEDQVAVGSMNKNVVIGVAIGIGLLIIISQIIFIVMKKRRSHTIQYERGDVLLSNSNYRETEILEEEPEETDNLLFSEP